MKNNTVNLVTKILFSATCVLLVVLLVMVFIKPVDKSTSLDVEVTNTFYVGLTKIEEVTIDSCEYYVVKKDRMFGITHKGNCKNHE